MSSRTSAGSGVPSDSTSRSPTASHQVVSLPFFLSLLTSLNQPHCSRVLIYTEIVQVVGKKTQKDQDVFLAPGVEIPSKGALHVGDIIPLPKLGSFTVAGLVVHRNKSGNRTCDVVLVRETRGALPKTSAAKWRSVQASTVPLPAKRRSSKGKHVNIVCFSNCLNYLIHVPCCGCTVDPAELWAFLLDLVDAYATKGTKVWMRRWSTWKGKQPGYVKGKSCIDCMYRFTSLLQARSPVTSGRASGSPPEGRPSRMTTTASLGEGRRATTTPTWI